MNGEIRDKLLAAIVAFRVHIESIDAKAKLGQNRKPEDIRSAAAALDSSDALSHQRQVAELMRGVAGLVSVSSNSPLARGWAAR